MVDSRLAFSFFSSEVFPLGPVSGTRVLRIYPGLSLKSGKVLKNVFSSLLATDTISPPAEPPSPTNYEILKMCAV